MTTLDVTAQAGTWKFSCADGGSSAKTYTNSYVFMGNPSSHSDTIKWVPPADATGTSYSLPSFGFDTSGGTADADTQRVADVSITAKITMTWMPDTSLPSDPAPTSLWLIESSSAQWTAQYRGRNTSLMTGSGSADDGIGDAPVATSANGIQSGEVSSSGSVTSTTTPPAHWFQQPVNGGVVTLTRTFHASDSASLPQDGWSGSMTTGCSFGGYTVSIHAQPYNWHITGVVANGDNSLDSSKADGSLEFYYDWSSTSGSKADLKTCFIHEWVTYAEPVGTATFPLSYTMPAPFSGSLFNPTVLPGTGTNGQPATDPGGYDHQGMPNLSSISPHVTGGFTGTQKYEFDDTATGETNTIIPGPDSGPLSIVRSVHTSGGIVWQYTLTKSGYTVTKTI